MTQHRFASRAVAGLLAAGALVFLGVAPAQAATTQPAASHRVHTPTCDTGWNGT